MSFMILAPEIRIKVYWNLLSSNPEDDIRPFDASLPVCYTTTSKLYPAILRVNKQVYAEASYVLYTANTFTLDLKDKLGAFPEYGRGRSLEAARWSAAATKFHFQLTTGVLHAQNLRRMRHIVIQIDSDSLRLQTDFPSYGKVPSRVIGKILGEVLRCLGTNSELEDVEADTQRTFKLHVLIPRTRMDIDSFTIFKRMMADIRWYLRFPGDVKMQRKVEMLLVVVHQGISVGKIDVEGLGLGLV